MAKIQLDKETKSALANEIATRQNLKQSYALFNYLPDPDPILKKMNKDITVYKDLTSDPHVFANIQQRQAGVTSQSKIIRQNNAPDDLFYFIQQIFDKLDLDNIITQMLNSTLYGMSVSEIIWAYSANKIIPVKIQEKPVEWFRFNNNNELLFYPDSAPNTAGVQLPLYKFLLVRNKPTYQNPYGERALSRCFWPVSFKRGGLKFWVTFTEKYASPYMFGKVPRSIGSEAVDDLLTKLDNLISDAVGVIPDDSSIEIKWPESGAAVEAYRHFLEFMNTEISKAILTQSLTTEIQNRGTYSASKTHEDMLEKIIQGDKKLIEASLNELIKYICIINFGLDSNLPTFQLYKEDPEELKNTADRLKTTSERDNNLQSLGISLTPEYFKKTYNLSDSDFSISNTPLLTKERGRGEVIYPPGSHPKIVGDTKARSLSSPEQLSIKDKSGHIESQLLTDDFLRSISAHKLLAAQQQIDQQLIEIINNSDSYDQLTANILDAFPSLTADKLSDMLQRAMFLITLVTKVTNVSDVPVNNDNS